MRRSAKCSLLLACLALGCPIGALVAHDGSPDSSTDARERVSDGGPDVDTAPYPAAVLEDAPIAYWRFNETSGTQAFDETGHGHTLTVSGNITMGVPGALALGPNLAFQLDGMTSGLTSDHEFTEFVGRAPYSLEAWIKPAAPSDPIFRQIFQRAVYPPDARAGYGVWIREGGLGFERYVDNVQHFVSAAAPTVGTFTHIVGTYDGRQLILYVNGMQTADSPYMDARDAAATGVPLRIGYNGEPQIGVINGVLDEVAVYGSALPSARVKAHYAAAFVQ
jgi:large repetitive protein